jgi:2-hydroxychromene-2-carboxylate isomerase
MTPIDFYFDFASPYGFIAAMQIETLARPVRWRPFLLGSIYKAIGQSPLEHPLKREYVIDVDAPRMARQIGLQLKVPAGFPEHSLPSSRMFYWIDRQDPAKAIEFAKAAYRKYWLHGCSTSDATLALDVAASVGYEREDAFKGMQESEIKNKLVFENKEAIRRRVFGSPFFFADGERFWGSDRISMLSDGPHQQRKHVRDAC